MVNVYADDEDEEIAQARLAVSLAERTGNPASLALAHAVCWALRHRHPDEAIAAFDRSLVLTKHAAISSVLAVALSHGA
jgi:hypothetical protein